MWLEDKQGQGLQHVRQVPKPSFPVKLSFSRRRFSPLSFSCSCLLMAAAFLPGRSAEAANTVLFWDADGDGSSATGGTGIWDTSSLLWRPGSSTGTPLQYWTNESPSTLTADLAGGSGTLTVASGTTINVNAIVFGVTGDTIAGADSTSVLNLDGTTPTITTGAGNTETISANLSGTAGLVKANDTGKLILSGVNTYTGTTLVSGGTLQFNSAASIGGSGASVVDNATVVAGYAIDQAFLGRISSSSTGNIGVATDSTSDLDFSSATGSNFGGYLVAANASGVTLSGVLTPKGTTYKIGGGTGTVTLTATNALSGAANGLAVNGNLVLTSGNSIGGTVSLGAFNISLTVKNSAAVNGATNNGLGTSSVNLGLLQTLNLRNDGDGGTNANVINFGNNITASGASSVVSVGAFSASGVANKTIVFGTLTLATGNVSNTFSVNQATTGYQAAFGAVTIQSATGVAITAPTTFGAVGQSSAGQALTKEQSGTLYLTAPGSYTGGTYIDNGAISVNAMANLSSGTIHIGGADPAAGGGQKNGVLIYTGSGETSGLVMDLAGTTGNATIDTTGATGPLTLTSDFTASGAGTKTLTLSGNTAGNTIGGRIVDNSSTNVTQVTKAGAGAWTLAGVNTYTGVTAVNAGTLIVTGSITGSTTVSSGATLAGSGTVGAITVNGGGILNPGANPGTPSGILMATGNVTLSGATTHLAIQLGATSSGNPLLPTAGTDYGQLALGSSAISLNGADLKLTLGAGYTHVDDALYAIITGASASITTTFAQGALIVVPTGGAGGNGDTFQIFYNVSPTNVSIPGNAVVLEAVPEPASGALGLLGIGALLGLRRARRAAVRR